MATPALLTVLTLNTWKGDGAYGARLRAMARLVAGAGADVVALQEVLQVPAAGLDTAATLANAGGLVAQVLPARGKPRPVEGTPHAATWSGMALLTRRPVLARALPLPVTPGADDDRWAQVADLILPGCGRLTVVNLHLTHPPDEAAMRRLQMARVLESVLAGPAERVLLLGDLNDPPDGPAACLPFSWPSWRCRDAVAEGNGGVLFPTTAHPPQVLDRVLLLERPAAAPLRILDAVALGGDLSPPPSDHAAVRVRFAAPQD